LRIGPACEAGLSTGMRRERVSPQIRKKKKKERTVTEMKGEIYNVYLLLQKVLT